MTEAERHWQRVKELSAKVRTLEAELAEERRLVRAKTPDSVALYGIARDNLKKALARAEKAEAEVERHRRGSAQCDICQGEENRRLKAEVERLKAENERCPASDWHSIRRNSGRVSGIRNPGKSEKMGEHKDMNASEVPYAAANPAAALHEHAWARSNSGGDFCVSCGEKSPFRHPEAD